ncbi:MAG: crotonase/enoyl-CoA hydratase family protein [Burkholderiaceae bacterium]
MSDQDPVSRPRPSTHAQSQLSAAHDSGKSRLLRYEFEAGIATITMDDGKANVMGLPMLQALNAALDRAQADRAVVVLTGRPGMFCAGFDLAVFKHGDPQDQLHMLEAGARLTQRLLAFPYPVIALCTGHAIAMGAFILLCVDLRIGVSGTSIIQVNEVEIGLTLPRFAVEVCRQRLSPAHLVLAAGTAHRYSAAQALAAGFLDELAASELLSRAVRANAESLQGLYAESFMHAKQRLHGVTLNTLNAAIDADVAEWAQRIVQ